MLLELVRTEPAWDEALRVALRLPPGREDRRAGEDPWRDVDMADEYPRRIAEDLAWLRVALDRPEDHGLRELQDTAAVGAWAPDEACGRRLYRLQERGVLDVAGFLLHAPDED